MSHFTVMVIGFNPEEQLARFSEHINVPEYRRREVIEKDKTDMLKYYASQGKKYKSFNSCYKAHGKEWNDLSWRKDEDGTWNEYSTCNPDGKWDWYVLGGRWSGSLRLKPCKKGKTGKPGVSGNVPGIDQAFKKDIDFEGIYADAREQARNQYQAVVKQCGGEIPRLIIPAPDRRDDLPSDANFKELWEEYRSQDSVRYFQEKVSSDYYGPELDDFQCTEEEYIRHHENQAVATFAYVINGAWNERGSMGAGGHVRKPMNQWDWWKHMRELVDALPCDTLISIYDCHI